MAETWLNLYKLKSFKLPGYKIISEYCRSDHTGGGVALLAKVGSKLTVKPLLISELNELRIDGIFAFCFGLLVSNGLLFITVI